MLSKCSKCEGALFRIQEQEPNGSRVKMFFVQCSKCATPVGVVDYFPNRDILQKVANVEGAVEALKSDIGNLDYLLRQVISRMR